MGISGKVESLLNVSLVRKETVPVIKRFSGGGTVVVDEQTLFVSFILAKGDLDILPFPEPILRWTSDLYTKAWKIPDFHLRENDYCIKDKKCGGNAQYIRKERWLHHTSFLWDYNETNMDYLLLPPKRPQYRQDRSHNDFLCRLNQHAPNIETRIGQLKDEIVKRFYIQPFDLSTINKKSHRQVAQYIDLEETETTTS